MNWRFARFVSLRTGHDGVQWLGIRRVLRGATHVTLLPDTAGRQPGVADDLHLYADVLYLHEFSGTYLNRDKRARFEFDKISLLMIFLCSWTSIASKSSPASVWCMWSRLISAYGYALWFWRVSRRSLSITRNWVRFRRGFSVSEIYLKNQLSQTT